MYKMLLNIATEHNRDLYKTLTLIKMFLHKFRMINLSKIETKRLLIVMKVKCKNTKNTNGNV